MACILKRAPMYICVRSSKLRIYLSFEITRKQSNINIETIIQKKITKKCHYLLCFDVESNGNAEKNEMNLN